jgi:YHS domain-containing protein
MPLRTAPAFLVMLLAASGRAESGSLDSLRPFNFLVGKWNASGTPEGSADEKQKGHWTETLEWGFQFKGDDAWMIVTFDKGKYFAHGELRHDPKENVYRFKVETTDKKSLAFAGPFKDKELRLERTDPSTQETQRLVFSLLHGNRIVYRYETRAAGRTFFTKVYRVGATKDGEPLVTTGFDEKECVVSGGRGSSTVTYMGKTYYVCCSGCRDAFAENPKKFADEFEKKRAKQK